MKKILSILLTLAMVLSLVPAVFAADEPTITMSADKTYDVNETGLVDINDAQLTYDIYSGKYTDFEKVSVRKFLRADVTKDKVVNSADAVAVVKNSK